MLGVNVQNKRILCISDQPELLRTVEDLFDVGSSAILIEAADEEEGVELAASTKPDLIMVDASLRRFGGLHAAGRIRDAWPEAKIIMVGNYVSEFQPL